MPALLRADTRLWTPGQVKPVGVPRIDWSHPLAQGLIFYGFDAGGVVVDLVGGRPQNLVPGATRANVGSSPWGAGILYNNSDGRYFASDAAIQNAQSGDFSFATGFVQTGTVGAYSRPFCRTANNGGSLPYLNFDFEINYSGAGQNNIQSHVSVSGPNYQTVGTWTGNSNNSFNALLISIGANFGRAYANGVLTGGTGTTPVGVNVNDAIIFSGASAAASNSPFIGFVFYGALWGRALSAYEALQLYLDPYCFLLSGEGELPALRLPSGTLYSLAGAAGSFSLTGEAATVAATRRLAGGEGAFTLTGEAAAGFARRRLAGAVGTFAMTGGAAATAAVRRLAGAVGSFALTGGAGALKTLRQLAGGAGSFLLNGGAAVLRAIRGQAPLTPASVGGGDGAAFSVGGGEAGPFVGAGDVAPYVGGGDES